MDEAWHYALSSQPLSSPGVWFLAEQQTKGRGRHQRLWHSPKGNLYCSFLFPDPGPLHSVPFLCFVTGLAVHSALSAFSSERHGVLPLRLKWPNDILIEGEKVGGILIESRHIGEEKRLCVVIGIGINCTSAPSDAQISLRWPTTYLTQWVPSLSAADLFHTITHHLIAALMDWKKNFCFTSIRQNWLEKAYGLGKVISMEHPAGNIKGIFSGIDNSGRLLCTIPDTQDIIACDSGAFYFLEANKKD
jgi:BirA family biotin operon repressor/biotin-[acetyl-CoA-carboxylase] ligase